MSDLEFRKCEIDANTFRVRRCDSSNEPEQETIESNSREMHNNTAVATVYNRNMLVSNTNSLSTNISFERCSGITLGSVVSVGLPQWSQSINTITSVPQDLEENINYNKKTPTIKAMMESNQLLNDKYLDIFCAKLGHKFQALCVHLMIDELDVQQAYEDHKQYGTSEVLFQILSRHFQRHDQNATVGWLTKFLWINNYKKNVWAVKDLWKLLKNLDEDTS